MIQIRSSNILSPLGWTLEENLQSLLKGRRGISTSGDRSLSEHDFPLSRIDRSELDLRFSDLDAPGLFTVFEKAAILSAKEALGTSGVDPVVPIPA